MMPTGPGTFTVAAHGICGNGSGAARKAIAMKAGGAHCQRSGQDLQVLDARTVEPAFGRPPWAEVNFRYKAKQQAG